MKIKGRLFAIFASTFFLSLKGLHIQFQGQFIDSFDLILSVVFLLIAYWSGKQYDLAKFYSEKDELTNVYNRRFLTSRWATRMTNRERSMKKHFVLAVDCDEFKYINDTYGHKVGDEVLKFVAKTLSDNTRKEDIVSRWGGDEFVVVGECPDEKGVIALMNRLQQKVEDQASITDLPISISIGYALYPLQSRNLEDLLKMADEQMYQEKSKKKAL